MGTLAIREDPDEMPYNVAFHQGLHCLLRNEQCSGTQAHLNLEFPDPLRCTMNVNSVSL